MPRLDWQPWSYGFLDHEGREEGTKSTERANIFRAFMRSAHSLSSSGAARPLAALPPPLRIADTRRSSRLANDRDASRI